MQYNYRSLFLRIVLWIICTGGFSTISLGAQAAAKPAAKATAGKGKTAGRDKKDQKDEKGDALDSSKDLANAAGKQPVGWTPEIAGICTVALPIGDAGSILNMGAGGRADFTSHIPALKFLKQGGFEIRPGFFGGMLVASSKGLTKKGSFFTAPAVGYVELDLTSLSKSVTPYFAFGGGVSMSSATSTTTVASATSAVGDKKSVSSVDGTLYAALGAKYYFGTEKKVFIKAEVAFFMLFEEVSGMFIQGNLGVGARL